MLYRRDGSPYWWYDFEVNGERYRASTRRTNKKDATTVAELARKEVLDRIQLGEAGLKPITLKSAVTEWLEKVGRHHADYPGYLSRSARLFGEASKGRSNFALDKSLPLHGITVRVLQDIVDARLADGLSAGTINRELALIRSVHNWARERYRTNTALVFPSPKRDRRLKEKPKLRWLTAEEITRLLAELNPQAARPGLPPVGGRLPKVQQALDDAYDLTVFLLYTGARWSEATSATWDVVDWTNRTINLYRDKVANEGMIVMPPVLEAVLRTRFENTKGFRVRGNPFIFMSRDGAGARAHSTKAIMKAMARAGLNAPHLVARYGRATPHTLRHTFASHLVQAGMALKKVAALLGHSSTQMVDKTYGHLAPHGAAVEAANILGKLAVHNPPHAVTV